MVTSAKTSQSAILRFRARASILTGRPPHECLGKLIMIRRLHVPLVKPEDVIPHLAKQELHWKAGYSAQELAVAWAGSRNDFPGVVRAVLESAPEYALAEFIDGFFE